MSSIPLKDLRRCLGRLLRERKPVVLTRRGKPVAKLLPLNGKSRPADLVAILNRFAGVVDDSKVPKDGSGRLDEYLYGPSRPRR